MSAEVIPFDFEEQAVRVVMRDNEPWFVAADICRVLEVANATDAVKRLDEDEVTLDTIEGSHRQTNLISESGLYALIFTSRKDEARRFRKWVTAEVLPAIRKTGGYEHVPAPANDSQIGDVASRDAELWLSMIREARLLGGTRAGRTMWARSPLPPLSLAEAPADTADGQACLAHLVEMAGPALDGGEPGEAMLTAMGLRAKPDGLFVANPGHPGVNTLFHGTKWAGGRYRAALLALPGVMASTSVYTLDLVSTRGIVVPFALIREAGQ